MCSVSQKSSCIDLTRPPTNPAVLERPLRRARMYSLFYLFFSSWRERLSECVCVYAGDYRKLQVHVCECRGKRDLVYTPERVCPSAKAGLILVEACFSLLLFTTAFYYCRLLLYTHTYQPLVQSSLAKAGLILVDSCLLLLLFVTDYCYIHTRANP